MSIFRRLTSLPEIIRRHLAGEPLQPQINVGTIEIVIPAARVAQFGYGDSPEELEDDDCAPGVH